MTRFFSARFAGARFPTRFTRLGAAVLLGALVAGSLAPQAFARPGAYLLDLVRTEPYRTAWMRMLAKERGLPSWVQDFMTTGDGVNTPSKMIPVGVKAFTYSTLCEPHDCAGNMLYVVFAPDGGQAYAKLVQAGKAPRLLGKPDAQTRSALDNAATE